jgi:hypothetical protein
MEGRSPIRREEIQASLQATRKHRMARSGRSSTHLLSTPSISTLDPRRIGQLGGRMELASWFWERDARPDPREAMAYGYVISFKVKV